jgi:hypothetical protein
MRPGRSSGALWLAVARGERPADGGPPLPAEIVRLVPDAVKRMTAEGEDVANHDVEVVLSPTTIELVFLPRLAPDETLQRGGATSLGREVHLHYDRSSGAFLRRHFAR